MLATTIVPALDPAISYEFSAARHYFDRIYGSGPDRDGLILECLETPRLSDADLVALHGDDHDAAPGDPDDLSCWSITAAEYQAMLAETEWLDWEREREVESRELTQHNREVMGWA